MHTLESNLQAEAPVVQKALRILSVFKNSVPYVAACAAVSEDGLVIASVLSDEVNVDRFGAMCASLQALSNRAATEVGRGALRQVILDGDVGPILLTQAGALGVLAVVAGENSTLGKAMLDARRVAGELAELAA